MVKKIHTQTSQTKQMTYSKTPTYRRWSGYNNRWQSTHNKLATSYDCSNSSRCWWNNSGSNITQLQWQEISMSCGKMSLNSQSQWWRLQRHLYSLDCILNFYLLCQLFYSFYHVFVFVLDVISYQSISFEHNEFILNVTIHVPINYSCILI